MRRFTMFIRLESKELLPILELIWKMKSSVLI